MESTLRHALKEWAIAIEALEQGKTILLLRKGGIREQSGRFEVACHTVLLYPTYEHQQPHLLKPEYASRVAPVESGWHPATVPIKAWAEITDIFQIQEAATVAALEPFQIWNQQFIRDRLKWKPQSPLYVLLLRTYRLIEPQVFPYRSEYGGCKSWIELEREIAIANSVPVMSDVEYTQQTDEIRNAIGFD